ncbi:hypothetical protein KCP73_12235 [Salmonella enterica subsp. enterica]|nr:hypothetical protein KCP73_12235 [Salmonella enterica subsp. enterica]
MLIFSVSPTFALAPAPSVPLLYFLNRARQNATCRILDYQCQCAETYLAERSGFCVFSGLQVRGVRLSDVPCRALSWD